jgi:hypothetical protein
MLSMSHNYELACCTLKAYCCHVILTCVICILCDREYYYKCCMAFIDFSHIE